MKKRIYKLICFACAVSAIASGITLDGIASVDKPVGKMSSTYGYVLNDYLIRYGAVMTDGTTTVLSGEDGGTCSPTGVVYGDIVNFDANENPYLVLYVTDGAKNAASCHIWRYNEETASAEQIAALEKQYDTIGEDRIGEFDLGWNDEKRYIIYREFAGGDEVNSEYYTVINGDALMYVKNPENANHTDIMDFNAYYFHPGVDVSDYNRSVNDFFDSLKNAAADSVTYEDIAERLTTEDESKLETTLSKAVTFDSFDIAGYDTLDEYRAALSVPTSNTRFYLISNMYNLGDEIYYVRFSTDRSYYNYALVRRSDMADSGYQILKVNTDCIPLADVELRQLKEDYSRNTLLYKKTKDNIKLQKKVKSPDEPSAPQITKAPKIIIDKMIDNRMRLPAACIGGGIAIALLTILWVLLYGTED